MEVLHYIADTHLRSLMRFQWHLLLLLYIAMCARSTTTRLQGANNGYDSTTTTTGTTTITTTTAAGTTTTTTTTTTATTMEPCVNIATTMQPHDTAAQVCSCNSTGLYCTNINPPLWEVPQVKNKNVRHLDLTGNAIEKIKKDSFLGLEFLETLCLGNNSIYFIHPYAFKNLYRLEMLNLEGNSLVNLDPSGRTFQHLSSLKFLYLQTSGITKVNKYSFLAMAASSTHVTVNLEGNPIACDCDLWALKQWKQTSATGSRTMINLYCDGRPYMEVPDTNSTFESCNEGTDAVFSDQTSCPVFVNESTNNRGLMYEPHNCSFLTEAVCHKTVAWDSSSHTMQLSSRCDSYDSCMQEEANNKDTCGLDFQSNKSVACSFCCRGPTCDKHSIGGRTRDFTFYLSFSTVILGTDFLSVINSTINEQIVLAFSGIEGGIDGNLYTYVDLGSSLHRLVLQVHLTTFNTMSEDEISRALENQSEILIRALFSGVLGTTSTVFPVSVATYFEGLECLTLYYPCPLNMICTASSDRIPRCLCDNSSFYNSADKTCSPLTKLQVANIIVSSATTDKVCLTWTAHTFGHNVTYSARVTPDVGESLVSSITSTGASFSGLHAGTEYNFTITSTLNAQFYKRLTETLLAGVWTKFGHGMTCDSTEMCDTDLGCNPSLDGRMRCLCNNTNFYLMSSRACLPMTTLQVSNLRVASSTNTSIKFIWTANKYGINVTYTIQPSPYKGQVVASSLGVSGAEWAGLDPGSQYNFTVTAWLVTDYYTRYIITPIWGIWTQAVHGGSCDVNGTNGRVCMGAHINCTQKYDGQAFCMCSPGYFVNGNKICEDVNELQVRNLTAILITNDTVVLRWTADKHGRDDVKYRINAESMREQLQTLVDVHGGYLTGLNSKTQYNFSVISVLPADNFYSEMTVTSDIISIWTKGLRNVTINISYIKQDEFLPFMSNCSSPEYKTEEKRITTGVTAVLVKNVDIIYVQLLQFDFIQISSQLYKVDLVIQLTTYDAKTIGQVLSHVQIDSQDTNGFFYKENFTSLDMAVNDTEIMQSKCPFSVTSLNNGGIIWNESNVGTHYSLCPLRNPLDDFKPMAKRTCFVQNDGDVFPVWGEVNITQCLTKEQNKTLSIFEVFERNITTENAEIASDYLKRITDNSSNLTVEMLNKSMASLEMLTTGRMLQLPNVATNVINCVNNMLNVNINILQQSEMDSNVSSRLLDVIDSVANKAPLDNGTFQISTENLAVHALTVNSTETRDITVTWQVSIDVLLGDNSQLSNTTSLMIPVKALVESLNDQQKQNLSRISFVVFHSDTLFSVIRKSGSRGKLHDDNDNDNHDHNNEVESRKNELYVTKINSRVVSASVPGVPVNNLSRNITMNFEHRIINASKPRCVFWDKKLSHGRGDWSEAGCGVVDSDANSTTCGCNHLTNFALLMDVYDQGSKLSAIDRKILSIISYVGCGISCFALLITLITYSAFKQVTNYSLSDHKQPKRNLRRDNPAKILINLCLALLCTNLVFLLGMQDYSFQNTASCKAVAVLLHYFLLASMSWMAVEAFYMYLALIVIFKTYYTNFILKCSIFGWGFPLLVIIITLAVNATDNYGFINSGLCWLKNPAFYAAFVGPVCFILLINCIAFILVVKQLASMSGVRLHKTERNSTIQRLRGAVGVVILLGLTWIFAIFAIDQASVVFYYLFAIFNSLQGLFIFIFYCLLKSDAVLAMKRSLPCFEEYRESTKSYSNSKGETNTTAGHHLMERKSDSSKKNDNFVGTLSTTLDSRKDSCFSTLSSINAINDKDGDGLISNPSMINHIKATSQLLHSSHDTSKDTSSTISANSDKPIRYFNGITEANPERGDITTADSPTEVQDTSFCQPPSEAGGGSVYNRVSAFTHDPQPMGSPSRKSQTESPEKSSPSLKHGSKTDEALHPSVRAEGEIDCSHLARVHNILHKFEHNILLTDIDNNVITAPEKPNQDYEDDTPSYTPTISDSPT